jgi:hypothetical protein
MRKTFSAEELRRRRIERFWGRVDKRGHDECWNWKHRVNKSGYGEVRYWANADRGRYQSAHRISWELVHGPLPKTPYGGYHGTVIAHTCDNRRCVNPAHLFATTQKWNLDDCLAKGRGNKAFGERAGKTELTEGEVLAIRHDAARGMDRAALAKRHDVCSQTIVDIVVGKTWAHLPLTTRTVAKAPREYNRKPNRTSFQKGSKGNPGPKPERRTADYDAIRALLSSGASYREIARKTGTTHTTVRRVAGG